MRETQAQKVARVRVIVDKLKKEYGEDDKCYLNYKKDWQLLFAVIMSAQCTDARVNIVTKDLWKKYKKLSDIADTPLTEFEEDIRSTGFYHNKAKNIKACTDVLLEKYGGKVPREMDELTGLPGVGRKTANVVRGELYGIQGMAVDTHVGRISRKLGLTKSEDPVKVEQDLMKVVPQENWIMWNHDIIALGRTICIARRERCTECFLRGECPSCER